MTFSSPLLRRAPPRRRKLVIRAVIKQRWQRYRVGQGHVIERRRCRVITSSTAALPRITGREERKIDLLPVFKNYFRRKKATVAKIPSLQMVLRAERSSHPAGGANRIFDLMRLSFQVFRRGHVHHHPRHGRRGDGAAAQRAQDHHQRSRPAHPAGVRLRSAGRDRSVPGPPHRQHGHQGGYRRCLRSSTSHR